jgi:hypothetical protein
MIPMGPPAAGTETETLIGALERQRRIFAWKTGGLDAAGLAVTVAAGTITLGGLLKHLALCEDTYFSNPARPAARGPVEGRGLGHRPHADLIRESIDGLTGEDPPPIGS